MKDTDFGITLSEAGALDRDHLRLTYLYVVGLIIFAATMLGGLLGWFSAAFVLPVTGALVAIFLAKASVETQINRFLAQTKKEHKNFSGKL